MTTHTRQFNRRSILSLGGCALAMTAVVGTPALASLTDDAIAALTGGAGAVEGGISITAPEIAENGNTVPVEIDAPGAVAITLFADGNPTPSVATFKFGALSASRTASTRIRLSTTQNVVAVAEMADGSFQMAKANVKVTIGGCGG